MKQTKDGFVYIDLEDAYIHQLKALLPEKTLQPPPFFETQDPIGAHIGVILEKEAQTHNLFNQIEEINTPFSFKITGCFVTYPQAWDGVKKVWFLTVKCSELEHLREKYSLPSKIGGHDFMIPFAIQKQTSTLFSKTLAPTHPGFFQVNLALQPA